MTKERKITLVVDMNKAGAATAQGEIEALIAEYITEKGLKRMIKIKGGN